MDEAFLAALFPRRHRILRRWLRPFCYGHVVTLHAIGSPLIDAPGSGAEIDAGQFLAALQVCAAPGYPFLRPDQVRPRLRDVLARWWLERSPARLRRAVDAFVEYTRDHGSFPEFYQEEDTDADGEAAPTRRRTLSAPGALARVCALISRTTISHAEAWQMPVALPSWYAGTLDEMEGAHVRFSPTEGEEDDLPDLSQLSEKELYAQAVQHLGPEKAKEWRKARRAAQRREKRQESKRRQQEENDHGC